MIRGVGSCCQRPCGVALRRRRRGFFCPGDAGSFVGPLEGMSANSQVNGLASGSSEHHGSDSSKTIEALAGYSSERPGSESSKAVEASASRSSEHPGSDSSFGAARHADRQGGNDSEGTSQPDTGSEESDSGSDRWPDQLNVIRNPVASSDTQRMAKRARWQHQSEQSTHCTYDNMP